MYVSQYYFAISDIIAVLNSVQFLTISKSIKAKGRNYNVSIVNNTFWLLFSSVLAICLRYFVHY